MESSAHLIANKTHFMLKDLILDLKRKNRKYTYNGILDLYAKVEPYLDF